MNDYPDSLVENIEFDGKDILEIGCGSGGFTLDHLLHARSILGIDPNSEAIETLKKQWRDQHEEGPYVFQVGNIVSFPLNENEFDIAIFSRSF